MDMSTNMIAVASTGSMLNAQTSDSIAGLNLGEGLDFQSMLFGMLGDTGSPVSEAFDANNLLTSILMAQTDTQGETNQSEPTETPFLEASEISRLLQGIMPMQSEIEPVKADTGQNADTADVGIKVLPEVQNAMPHWQARMVRTEVNQSFAAEENLVNGINKESDLQGAFQSKAETPNTEKVVVSTEPIPTEETQRATESQTSEFKAKLSDNVKLADRADANENPQVKTEETVTRPSGAEKETLVNTKESAFEKPENNLMSDKLEGNRTKVTNEEIKVDGNKRVVPENTQTEQKTETKNTSSEDVSAKHFANVLQNSEVKEATQTSATQQSAPTQQARPAYVQVANDVEAAMTEGKEEFTMQLSPEGLGEISVKLMKEGTKVTISIAAANPETHSLLLGSVDGLVKNLSLSHINVESVQIQQSANTNQEAPAPITSTESYDFNGQGADVNREGTQRENHGSHRSNSANKFFAETFDDREEVNETLEMLRTQMRVMDYLA